jgi:hypothetical protein
MEADLSRPAILLRDTDAQLVGCTEWCQYSLLVGEMAVRISTIIERTEAGPLVILFGDMHGLQSR